MISEINKKEALLLAEVKTNYNGVKSINDVVTGYLASLEELKVATDDLQSRLLGVVGLSDTDIPAAIGEILAISEEPIPLLSLVLMPNSITENGGSTAVTVTLSRPTSQATMIEISAAAVPPANANDFTLEGTTLTIAAGATASTGTVTITGVNNSDDAAQKSVTVSATVSGGSSVALPGEQILTLTDDDEASNSVD